VTQTPLSQRAPIDDHGATALEFTGERFTPECVREIWYEHWHRYLFARRIVAGKRVLDAACGEGYGSALLAASADSVLGVDIAESAVAHARQRYGQHANLRFEQGDCTALSCGDAQFDLIVSFETLEHVAAQQELIAGFARALAPGGLLIVSSPDKRTYSEKSGFRNEFHVRELYREELLELSGSGCPVIQMEEPNIHLIGIQRGGTGTGLGVDFFVKIFNNTVRGLRDTTEVWCHTCWGNPAQQRLFATNQSYKDALPHLNQLDVDVITFECCTSDGMDLELIGREITDKKIAIGVVNHRDLQVERPEQVADLIRRALKHIPAERLILSSDCGFGREGMSRRIAFFKMVSIVRGTNIVRRELGLPEAPCLAADARYAIADVIE